MKRSRHKRRPKFLESAEPVACTDQFSDFYCDLAGDLRRELRVLVVRASPFSFGDVRAPLENRSITDRRAALIRQPRGRVCAALIFC
jgi:hypothetical protein